MKVTDFLDRGAELYPDRHIVSDGTSGISYREFAQLTHRVANALQAEGLGPGNRVAVYSPNHALAFAAQYGIHRSGAAFVPLNARNSVHENAELVKTLEVDWLFYHSSFAEDARTLRETCAGVRGYVCIDAPDDHAPHLMQWTAAVPDEAPDLVVKPEDVWAIYTTSGTTGRPKGVVISHLTFECMTASFASVMHFDEPPVHLVVAPLTHTAGAYAGILLSTGATNVILPSTKPAVVLEAIERYKISTLFLPPTLIYMLLSDPAIGKHNYSSLRYFLYGAAPMSTEKLREASKAFGNVFMQLYGQTEASMPCAVLLPHEHAEALSDKSKEGRLASCGRAGPYAKISVMDDEGRHLPAGVAGEIVVRGNLVMNGYYANPEATAEASQFGWHHTGDIGRVDADGFIYLVDRKKDMIISGGFNVYPSEVEQVIWKHPAVQDCAVIGVPDEKWGEAVTAIVELKEGLNADPAELIKLCKEMLGGVKAPKQVHFWPRLPRSAVGKVLKKEIRAKFWDGRSRMI